MRSGGDVRLWQVLFSEDPGVGYARATTKVDTDAAWSGQRVRDWEPLACALIGGGWADYLGGDVVNLCSEPLREAIDRARGGAEPIQWLAHLVGGGGGERRRYWGLLVHDDTDRLDEAQTVTAAGQIVRPAFDAALVGDLEIVGLPGTSAQVFVGERVAAAVRSGGFTGIHLAEVRVV